MNTISKARITIVNVSATPIDCTAANQLTLSYTQDNGMIGISGHNPNEKSKLTAAASETARTLNKSCSKW